MIQDGFVLDYTWFKYTFTEINNHNCLLFNGVI